ncbi:Variant-specific surface protein, partial [Giardia duodenalis]
VLKSGCYDARAAPGSGVCREARDGACVRYKEEHTVDGGRHGTPVGVRAAGQCTDEANQQNCEANSCNVQIGSNVYCSQCKTGGNVPIDGVCADKADAVDKCLTADNQEITTEQVCGKCGDNHFLFKGGCYNVDTAPGNLICSAIDEKNTAVCKTCAAGYFKNPANVETSDSCIACGDATGVQVDSGPTYKGVANCAECTAPEAGSGSEQKAAKCTKCGNSKYLKTDGTCGESSECASGTEFAKEDTEKGNRCVSCGDKIDGIADCKTCSKTDTTLKCLTCNNDKKPNTAKTACIPCPIADCASCDKENVCATCDNGKYLTPTGQCVDGCGKLGGYYADNNVCQPCDPSCASCSTAGADKCLSCPAGKVLRYTSESNINGGGSCVDECRANTDGCVDCGAVIGGSKYCSKCSEASQAPLNGDCAANTARTKFCTNASNGACTQCANGYFLLDGGCYQTSRQPGSQMCTQADSNGQCSQCANTLSPSNGVCPACPAGCSTCSGSSTCTACLAGYYLDSTASKCVKCSENSTNGSNTITGVKDCVSCKEPSGASGTVTCYVTQTPTVNPADPSVNKTGLSSGAIAGISVAVIAVVGGLVGFLCWWFICRGKA